MALFHDNMRKRSMVLKGVEMGSSWMTLGQGNNVWSKHDCMALFHDNMRKRGMVLEEVEMSSNWMTLGQGNNVWSKHDCMALFHDNMRKRGMVLEGTGCTKDLQSALSMQITLVSDSWELQELSGRDMLHLNSQTLYKLLPALNECTEWGQVRQMVMIIRIDGDGNTNGASSQVFILDALAAYRCQTTKEAENIAERVMPRLQHVNSAVVLSAIKVLGACAALRVYACFGASVRAVKKKDRLVLAAIPAPSIEYIAGACCWKSSCDAAAAADDHVLMTLMLPAVAHAVDDNNVLALDAMRGNAGSQAVVLFHLMDYINEGNPAYEDTVKLWCKKMAPPLVTLLGSEPEVLKHMRSFTLLQAKTAHYSMLRPAALAVPLLLPHPHVGLRTGSIPSPCFAVSLLCIPLPYQH
eukprot:1160550-Pelagomonas_calceolata.AAC.5